MYDQIREDTFYIMLYTVVAAISMIACCYLLFRRANAIAPDITSPLRLRRWVAAFFASMTLSHVWYLPTFYLTSVEDIKMVYYTGALFDFMMVFPLAIAIMLVMLQDRRRPLWPIALIIAPIVVGMAVCTATRSDTIPMALYVYYLLLIIGIIIYMVRATRQYGRWLRDNYADLEHKEVWQSLVVLGIILLSCVIYAFELNCMFFQYMEQVNEVVLVCFLVWRTENLSSLTPDPSPAGEGSKVVGGKEYGDSRLATPLAHGRGVGGDTIGLLLQRHCIDEQLYLQHDLNLLQLAKAICTNRFYLSQYFSRQGTTYNAYINGLRIDHFVSLYHRAVAAKEHFTVQQLANDSGYRSYSTFNLAFKQRMGQTVNAWAKLQK